MDFTLDQLLWIVARIYTWDKSANELTLRGLDILSQANQAVKANKEVIAMTENGLNPMQMLKQKGLTFEEIADRFRQQYENRIADGSLPDDPEKLLDVFELMRKDFNICN